MIKKSIFFITTIFVFLCLGFIAPVSHAEELQYEITINTSSPKDRFNEEIFAKVGDVLNLKINSSEDQNYCCGVTFVSVDKEIASQKIYPGESKSIEFKIKDSTTLYAVHENGLISGAYVIKVEDSNTKPEPPEKLTIELRGDKFVDIGWSPVANATSYKILRDGEEVGTSTFPFYTDTNLTNDTEYLYTVIAQNIQIDSEPSKALTANLSIDSNLQTIRDTKYEMITTEDASYPENKFEPGKDIPQELIISGRVSRQRLLTIKLGAANTEVYTTTPDEYGYWSINIDTKSLENKIYQLVLSYSDDTNREKQELMFDLNFVSTEEESVNGVNTHRDNKTTGIRLIFASFVVGLVAVLIFLSQKSLDSQAKFKHVYSNSTIRQPLQTNTNESSSIGINLMPRDS